MGAIMAAPKPKQLSDLIGMIHDAGLDPTQWPAALAGMLTLLDVSAALLFSPLQTNSPDWLIASCGLADDFLNRCAEPDPGAETWIGAGMARRLFAAGRVLTEADFMPGRPALAVDYRQNALFPAGLSHLCCAVVHGSDDPSAKPTLMTLFRDHGAPSFGHRDKALSRMLARHIARALTVAQRLQTTKTACHDSLEALDLIATGVVIFDDGGQITHLNPACRRLLTADDKSANTTKGRDNPREAPMPPTNAAPRHLQALVARTLAGMSADRPGYGRLARGGSRSPLILMIMPCAGNKAGGQPHIGYLLDPDHRRPPDARLFADVYQLTPAEIRLLGHLAGGSSLGDIATATATSPETLKSQLKSIFQKTGTHRQGDLYGLVSALSVALPRESSAMPGKAG